MARVQLEDESVFTIGTSSPVTPHGHERKATFKTPSVNGSPRQQGSPRPRRKATPGRFVNTGDDTSDEDEGPKIQARRFKNLPSPTVAKTPTQETPKDEECVPTAPPPSRSGSMAEIQSNAVKQQQQAKILKSSSTHLKEPSSNGSTSSSEETDSSSRTSSTAVSSTPTDNGTVIDYGSDDNEKVTSYGKSRNVTPGKLLSDKAELLNLATMPTPTQTNLLVAFAQMEESSIDLTLAQISAMATAQSNIDRRAERDESASQPQTPVQNRAQSKRTLVQDAVSSPQESPASPLSRKKTWQERNGRWKLLDGTDGDADAPEEEELTSGRPLKDFVSPSVGHSLVHFGGSASLKNRAAGIPASNSGPLSPPSLPPPPARSESSHPFSLWPASPGPNGRAMSPLPHALTPPARVCQQDLFFSPPSLAKAYSSPGSDGRNVASPLSAARIAPSSSDGAGLQSSGSTVLKKQRSSKIKPSNSARSSPAQSSPKKFAPSSPSPSPSPLTPTRSPPPQRRAAMRPPKKYTAPLGGEVETRHVRSNTAPADFGEEVEEDLQAGLELSRAKSVVGPSRSPRRVRTPAEKERERQEAMDRVHSIVNRGYKERVAIRSPERGGNGPFTFNTP